jgi:uncharacterized SAM-binding protein YcdF (DUF218 family)
LGGTLFFTLSKVFAFLASPGNVMLMLGVIGVVLMPTRFARMGRRLAALAIVLLAVAGYTPVGRMLLVPLEQQFPPWSQGPGPAPTGIVVLGGSVDVRLSQARGDAVLNDAAERITATVALARRFPQARVIFSGGSGSLLAPEAREAPVARRLLAGMGISPERIEFDERSRNTAENAALSREIAQPKPGERWLLVTSAAHMPRAVGVFRRAGFPVEAYPVDWRTAGYRDVWLFSDGITGGLDRLDAAAHEWIGLAAYWLTGRTATLLPGAPPRCAADAGDACRP